MILCLGILNPQINHKITYKNAKYKYNFKMLKCFSDTTLLTSLQVTRVLKCTWYLSKITISVENCNKGIVLIWI